MFGFRMFRFGIFRIFRGRLFAFSLIEVMVALLVVAIIVAALAPVITKRLTGGVVGKSRISTSCSSLFPEGYCGMCYLNPKSCIVCTKVCKSDEFQNVSECSCVKCSIHHNDSNCTRCNSKYCTQCKQGYYLDSNNRCTICPKGYYCYQDNSNGVNGDGGVSVKKPCPKGYAAPNEGMSACVACNKSTSSVQGSVAINEGSVNCTLCTNGYYAGTQGQSVGCNKCPSGYYCPSGKLIACAKGTSNNQTGRYSACASCVKSMSSVQGSVATNTAMTSCSLCTNGYYASVSSQTTSCNICPRGYYCPNGKIIPCAKGSANNQTGRYTSCVLCSKSTSTTQGSVATTTAMTSCSVCNNGYYASTQGQTTNCIKCPSGYYCPNGKLIACVKGYYCPQGSSSQKACPAGKYSSSTNATSCSTCPKGTYSNTGASSCISCPKGSYSSNSGSSSCTKCAKGYYASNTGSRSCTKCSAGYYSNTGASSCTKCASGYYSNSGASSCTKCSSKYPNCVKCDNNKCIECEDGYEPSDDGTECEKKGCPDKTVEISAGGKKLCVTQYNMGDDASFPLSGVTTVSTNTYCKGSSACCWKGTTSSICNSDNGGYSGCGRTVCTHPAAEIVCANLKYDDRTWRLPTSAELESFTSYSINKGASGLMLCDYYSGYGSAMCRKLDSACSGADYSLCNPSSVWSGTLYGNSSAFYNYLSQGFWSWKRYNRSYARSARCVTELEEE